MARFGLERGEKMEELKVTVEVNATWCLLFLKVARLTIPLWFLFRRQMLPLIFKIGMKLVKVKTT